MRPDGQASDIGAAVQAERARPLAMSHLAGIAALLALAPVAHWLSPLWLAAITTAILLVVGAWEALSLGVADRSPME